MHRAIIAMALFAGLATGCGAQSGSDATPAAGTAVGELRWKLKIGEMFNVRLSRTEENTISGPAAVISNNCESVIDESWRIIEVNQQGAATVRQEVIRFQMTSKSAEGTKHFDSANSGKQFADPEGFTKRTMPVASWTFVIGQRGEILSVTLDKEAIAALHNSPPPPLQLRLPWFTEDGLKRTLQQMIPTFPPMLARGDTWKQDAEIKHTDGNQWMHLTFTYRGSVLHQGAVVELVTWRGDYDPGDYGKARGVVTKVLAEDNHGEIYFDTVRGRPLEYQTSEKIKSSSTFPDGQCVQETKKTVSRITWEPAK